MPWPSLTDPNHPLNRMMAGTANPNPYRSVAGTTIGGGANTGLLADQQEGLSPRSSEPPILTAESSQDAQAIGALRRSAGVLGPFGSSGLQRMGGSFSSNGIPAHINDFMNHATGAGGGGGGGGFNSSTTMDGLEARQFQNNRTIDASADPANASPNANPNMGIPPDLIPQKAQPAAPVAPVAGAAPAAPNAAAVARIDANMPRRAYGGTPVRQAIVGDPQADGGPNPEIVTSASPIHVTPLKGNVPASGGGLPRFANGNTGPALPVVSEASTIPPFTDDPNPKSSADVRQDSAGNILRSAGNDQTGFQNFLYDAQGAPIGSGTGQLPADPAGDVRRQLQVASSAGIITPQQLAEGHAMLDNGVHPEEVRAMGESAYQSWLAKQPQQPGNGGGGAASGPSGNAPPADNGVGLDAFFHGSAPRGDVTPASAPVTATAAPAVVAGPPGGYPAEPAPAAAPPGSGMPDLAVPASFSSQLPDLMPGLQAGNDWLTMINRPAAMAPGEPPPLDNGAAPQGGQQGVAGPPKPPDTPLAAANKAAGIFNPVQTPPKADWIDQRTEMDKLHDATTDNRLNRDLRRYMRGDPRVSPGSLKYMDLELGREGAQNQRDFDWKKFLLEHGGTVEKNAAQFQHWGNNEDERLRHNTAMEADKTAAAKAKLDETNAKARQKAHEDYVSALDAHSSIDNRLRVEGDPQQRQRLQDMHNLSTPKAINEELKNYTDQKKVRDAQNTPVHFDTDPVSGKRWASGPPNLRASGSADPKPALSQSEAITALHNARTYMGAIGISGSDEEKQKVQQEIDYLHGMAYPGFPAGKAPAAGAAGTPSLTDQLKALQGVK